MDSLNIFCLHLPTQSKSCPCLRLDCSPGVHYEGEVIQFHRHLYHQEGVSYDHQCDTIISIIVVNSYDVTSGLVNAECRITF